MKTIGDLYAVGELLLQFETVEAREVHIEHQAAGHDLAGVGQEVLRRREQLRLPTLALDQQFQRLANRDVVVDDVDDRLDAKHPDGLDRVGRLLDPV